MPEKVPVRGKGILAEQTEKHQRRFLEAEVHFKQREAEEIGGCLSLMMIIDESVICPSYEIHF